MGKVQSHQPNGESSDVAFSNNETTDVTSAATRNCACFVTKTKTMLTHTHTHTYMFVFLMYTTANVFFLGLLNLPYMSHSLGKCGDLKNA
jgi:hypothetical protein